MDKAIVLFPAEPKQREALQAALPDMEVLFHESRDAKTLREADLANTRIFFGNPRRSLLPRCPKLAWVQLSSAGTDGYTTDVLGEDIQLTNATGAFGHSIAEYMVGYVFALYKKLHLYRDEQSQSSWQGRGEVRSVLGTTVLVVGLGDIGGAFAWRMKALGCRVLATRRAGTSKPDSVDELYVGEDALEKALPHADIVAICVPGNEETRGMFSRERFAAMKKDAILLNVGRGIVVDTAALCDALESGNLYGAALDVTDPEPLPPQHKLWKMENAIITPHVSGGVHMRETYETIWDIFIDNATCFAEGRPLRNIVDRQTGYRKL